MVTLQLPCASNWTHTQVLCLLRRQMAGVECEMLLDSHRQLAPEPPAEPVAPTSPLPPQGPPPASPLRRLPEETSTQLPKATSLGPEFCVTASPTPGALSAARKELHTCPFCGHDVDPGANFCSNCGASLAPGSSRGKFLSASLPATPLPQSSAKSAASTGIAELSDLGTRDSALQKEVERLLKANLELQSQVAAKKDLATDAFRGSPARPPISSPRPQRDEAPRLEPFCKGGAEERWSQSPEQPLRTAPSEARGAASCSQRGEAWRLVVPELRATSAKDCRASGGSDAWSSSARRSPAGGDGAHRSLASGPLLTEREVLENRIRGEDRAPGPIWLLSQQNLLVILRLAKGSPCGGTLLCAANERASNKCFEPMFFDEMLGVLPAEVPGCPIDSTPGTPAVQRPAETISKRNRSSCDLLDSAETLQRERALVELEEFNRTLVATRASMQGVSSELAAFLSNSEHELVEARIGFRAATSKVQELQEGMCDLQKQVLLTEKDAHRWETECRSLSQKLRSLEEVLAAQRGELMASEVCRLQAVREASVHEERHELALTQIADGERERESLELANMLLKAEYDDCLNERQELLAQKTCCVCMHSLRSVVLRPCSHFALCTECAERISSCPMCRVPVEHRIVVMLS
ncbi:rngB [Symbiodinium sp. CCMP2456]|nr:rngB [Symbiodinium sp. CCMP2456]